MKKGWVAVMVIVLLFGVASTSSTWALAGMSGAMTGLPGTTSTSGMPPL